MYSGVEKDGEEETEENGGQREKQQGDGWLG